jgi:hypothetical protein
MAKFSNNIIIKIRYLYCYIYFEIFRNEFNPDLCEFFIALGEGQIDVFLFLHDEFWPFDGALGPTSNRLTKLSELNSPTRKINHSHFVNEFIHIAVDNMGVGLIDDFFTVLLDARKEPTIGFSKIPLGEPMTCSLSPFIKRISPFIEYR